MVYNAMLANHRHTTGDKLPSFEEALAHHSIDQNDP